MSKLRLTTLSAVFLLILAACSTAPSPEPAPPAAAENPVEEPAAPEPTSQPETEAPPPAPTEGAAGFERPDWQQIELSDVRSGESFRLMDFEDQVVIVETMAVWCPLCEDQQLEIRSALERLNDERVVAISLNVDPGESAEISAAHADSLGLPWRFALSGDELSALLLTEFGPQILAPPSTPVLVIAPDGTFQLTRFGIKGADELADLARSLLP